MGSKARRGFEMWILSWLLEGRAAEVIAVGESCQREELSVGRVLQVMVRQWSEPRCASCLPLPSEPDGVWAVGSVPGDAWMNPGLQKTNRRCEVWLPDEGRFWQAPVFTVDATHWLPGKYRFGKVEVLLGGRIPRDASWLDWPPGVEPHWDGLHRIRVVSEGQAPVPLYSLEQEWVSFYADGSPVWHDGTLLWRTGALDWEPLDIPLPRTSEFSCPEGTEFGQIGAELHCKRGAALHGPWARVGEGIEDWGWYLDGTRVRDRLVIVHRENLRGLPSGVYVIRYRDGRSTGYFRAPWGSKDVHGFEQQRSKLEE